MTLPDAHAMRHWSRGCQRQAATAAMTNAMSQAALRPLPPGWGRENKHTGAFVGMDSLMRDRHACYSLPRH